MASIGQCLLPLYYTTSPSVNAWFGMLTTDGVAQGDRRKAQDSFALALDLDTTGELAALIERAMGEAS